MPHDVRNTSAVECQSGTRFLVTSPGLTQELKASLIRQAGNFYSRRALWLW